MDKTADIFEGKDGQWYLRLIAVNGETLMSSEGHKNLVDVRNLWKDYFPDWTLALDGVRTLPEGGES